MDELYIKEFRGNETSLEVIIWEKMWVHASCRGQGLEKEEPVRLNRIYCLGIKKEDNFFILFCGR